MRWCVLMEHIQLLVLSIFFFGRASIYVSKHKPTDTHFVSRLDSITARSLSRFAWLEEVAFHFMLLSTVFVFSSSCLRSCLHKILTAFVCMRLASSYYHFRVVLSQQNRSTLPFKTFNSIFLLYFQPFLLICFFSFSSFPNFGNSIDGFFSFSMNWK